MKRLTFDFETRSACELKKAGAYKYSLDPTTQPTCLAIKTYDDSEVKLFKFDEINSPFESYFYGFRNYWRRIIESGYEFSAHNAYFETCIYKNILVKRYGWPDIPFKQFRCTAAKAAACALPRNLEGAGAAMALTTQKDKRGYAAMMKTCKPTKNWNAWRKLQEQVRTGARISETKKKKAKEPEPPKFLEPDADPATWKTLYEYCIIDVKTEELLDRALPDLIPAEQEIWFLNQRMNWNGLRVDIPTIKKVVGIMEVESKNTLKELDTLTMGLVTKPGARQSILDFLALEGIVLPDIRAKTVDDFLKDGDMSDDMRRLLEIRKALSKTSTRKYQAFLDRAGVDDRVRDILLYHGASTGRDSGTGIQPHNFPKGTIKVSKGRPYATVENVVECDTEMLKILYGDSLSIVFSSILRNMIIPSAGHTLYVADFSKIEVAVLWWLADNWPGLKILNSGKDPYIYQAMANTGRRYEEIADDGDDRQLGKAQILGGGFGMGWGRFQTTAWDFYRLKLTDEQSKEAIRSYREANKAVPILWKAYENAAVRAIEDGARVKAGKCIFFTMDKFLWVQLPSGRRLAYREPRISWRQTEYGPRKTVEFMAVNPKTKKWALERTWGGTLTENIVQAIARDLAIPSMLRLEKAGYRPLLSVHDEALCESKGGSSYEFVKILCTKPAWADKNLPLDAKGWTGPRYRK